MKVGGKRLLEVPKNLAPPGVDLPSGVALTYEVELTEVLSGYF
jgi:FKBP-type peptidyl-prolyl cis-trans isomerase